MKFLELKIGDAFEHEGEHYQKSTPLVAINTISGKQKLFKRATVVTSLPSLSNPIIKSTSTEALINLADLHTSLLTLHQKNIATLRSLNLPHARLDKAIKQLETARDNFYRSLNIKPELTA